MKREDIKAVNGVGPGTTRGAKASAEQRAYAKVRESNKRRAENPCLQAYARDELKRIYREG